MGFRVWLRLKLLNARSMKSETLKSVHIPIFGSAGVWFEAQGEKRLRAQRVRVYRGSGLQTGFQSQEIFFDFASFGTV